MQLNEILEEHTLESISERTRIPLENLESLINGDWERLKKVQALGFISILEREYGADLSGLRKECRNYFDSHRPTEKRISVTSEEVVHTERHRFSKFTIALVLMALAYGSWYLFVDQNRELESNATAAKNEGFYETVLQMANGWFGVSAEKKEPATFKADEASNVSSEKGEEATVLVGTDLSVKKNKESTEQTKNPKKQNTPVATELSEKSEKKRIDIRRDVQSESAMGEDERIIARVKQEQAAEEQRSQTQQKNLTTEEMSQTKKDEENATKRISSLEKRVSGEEASQKTETPKRKETASAATESDKRKQPAEAAPEPKSSEAEAKQAPKPKAAKAPKASGSTLVLLHPRSKVWIGYTELRSMKRVATVTSREIPFDTATGDYIVAVGHGKLEFNGAGGKTLLKLADGKKHFFMVARGGVREISHEAFQRLNKSKVW